MKEKARLQERKLENHYKFFPVDHEEWTWIWHKDSLASRELNQPHKKSGEKNTKGQTSAGRRYG